MGPALASEFSIERSESPLTATLLAPYDALMVVSPDRIPGGVGDIGTSLSASEVQAVQQFVSSGRGLMVLGDCNIDASVNQLLAGTGISFTLDYGDPPWKRTACVYEQNTSPINGTFTISDITPHDATDLLPSYLTTWGTAMTVNAPAVGLARTAAKTFADALIWPNAGRQYTYNAGEPVGPLPVVAVSTLGAGRVYAWGDNAIGDAGFTYMNLTAMMRSALRWIVKSPAGRRPRRHAAGGHDRSTRRPLLHVRADGGPLRDRLRRVGHRVGQLEHGCGRQRDGDRNDGVDDGRRPASRRRQRRDGDGGRHGGQHVRGQPHHHPRRALWDTPAASLVSTGTTIRAIHIIELRQVIDELRVRFGLTRYAWTDPTLVPGATLLKRVHVARVEDGAPGRLLGGGPRGAELLRRRHSNRG